MCQPCFMQLWLHGGILLATIIMSSFLGTCEQEGKDRGILKEHMSTYQHAHADSRRVRMLHFASNSKSESAWFGPWSEVIITGSCLLCWNYLLVAATNRQVWASNSCGGKLHPPTPQRFSCLMMVSQICMQENKRDATQIIHVPVQLNYLKFGADLLIPDILKCKWFGFETRRSWQLSTSLWEWLVKDIL